MNLKEVSESLCNYDLRNIDGVKSYMDQEEIKELGYGEHAAEDCYCDNCHYERTPLAEALYAQLEGASGSAKKRSNRNQPMIQATNNPLTWERIDQLKEQGTKMLTLTLKKEWYDCIKSGFKQEEYRAMKPYYNSRLMKKGTDEFKDFEIVVFTNGYGRSVPHMVVELEGIRFGKGKPNWGAKHDEVYYVLELGGVVYAS